MSCPICANETVKQFRPFCSRRCADLDLGKWLTGAYSVPIPDDDEAGDPVVQSEEDAPRPH